MVTRTEAVARFPSMNKDVAIAGWKQADSQFPVRITRSWFNRIQSSEDPVGKQVFPQPTEMRAEQTLDGLYNPVGEQEKMPVPFVVQKHDQICLYFAEFNKKWSRKKIVVKKIITMFARKS